MQSHIINPNTKRMISVKSKQAIRLAKTGSLSPADQELVLQANKKEEPEVQSPPEEVQSPEEVKEPVIIQSEAQNKRKLKKELKNIANENKDKFVGITQEQSDELLKKMLYEKLFLSNPKSFSKKKPLKEKKKKKKSKVVSDYCGRKSRSDEVRQSSQFQSSSSDDDDKSESESDW